MEAALMAESVASPTAPHQPTDPGLDLAHTLRVLVLAERVLQVATDSARASLDPLTPAARERYQMAAAVALALVEPERSVSALYAAAHRQADLGAMSPVARRGLVQMVGEVVERFAEVLGGRHPRVVAQLEPLIAIDRAAARQFPEGVM